jgi:hypothetical protein
VFCNGIHKTALHFADNNISYTYLKKKCGHENVLTQPESRQFREIQRMLCPVSTQWVLKAVSPGAKWPWHDVNHSPASSAEVKNEWNYYPICLNGMDRGNFTFTFVTFEHTRRGTSLDRKKRNACRILVGKPLENEYLED